MQLGPPREPEPPRVPKGPFWGENGLISFQSCSQMSHDCVKTVVLAFLGFTNFAFVLQWFCLRVALSVPSIVGETHRKNTREMTQSILSQALQAQPCILL